MSKDRIRDQKSKDEFVRNAGDAIKVLAKEFFDAQKTFLKVEIVSLTDNGMICLAFSNLPEDVFRQIIQGSKEDDQIKLLKGPINALAFLSPDEKELTAKAQKELDEMQKSGQSPNVFTVEKKETGFISGK